MILMRYLCKKRAGYAKFTATLDRMESSFAVLIDKRYGWQVNLLPISLFLVVRG